MKLLALAFLILPAHVYASDVKIKYGDHVCFAEDSFYSRCVGIAVGFRWDNYGYAKYTLQIRCGAELANAAYDISIEDFVDCPHMMK